MTILQTILSLGRWLDQIPRSGKRGFENLAPGFWRIDDGRPVQILYQGVDNASTPKKQRQRRRVQTRTRATCRNPPRRRTSSSSCRRQKMSSSLQAKLWKNWKSNRRRMQQREDDYERQAAHSLASPRQRDGHHRAHKRGGFSKYISRYQKERYQKTGGVTKKTDRKRRVVNISDADPKKLWKPWRLNRAVSLQTKINLRRWHTIIFSALPAAPPRQTNTSKTK